MNEFPTQNLGPFNSHVNEGVRLHKTVRHRRVSSIVAQYLMWGIIFLFCLSLAAWIISHAYWLIYRPAETKIVKVEIPKVIKVKKFIITDKILFAQKEKTRDFLLYLKGLQEKDQKKSTQLKSLQKENFDLKEQQEKDQKSSIELKILRKENVYLKSLQDKSDKLRTELENLRKKGQSNSETSSSKVVTNYFIMKTAPIYLSGINETSQVVTYWNYVDSSEDSSPQRETCQIQVINKGSHKTLVVARKRGKYSGANYLNYPEDLENNHGISRADFLRARQFCQWSS